MIPWLLILLAAAASAQTASEPPAIEAGFEQRTRNENWNNIFDFTHKLDDETEQIRYRTRAWIRFPVLSTIDIFAGLDQETNQKLGKENRFDEVIFDNLYVDFKRLFVKGLSFRVGRQNIMKGEGFLVFEATPWDGSRTIYFNAAVLGYDFRKSRLELIGILDPARERLLPAVNANNRLLQEWDEQAIGAYYTGRDLPSTALDAYYFYKKEIRDTRPASNPQFQPDRHVSTAGGRIVRMLGPLWSATGEFAAQWGAQHGGRGIRAWGGYGYLKRTFDSPRRPYLQAGYWGFSGDDSRTPSIEGWDPLFSRWPKWSEMYIYSQFREVGVGYWTNTGMWQAEAGCSPVRRSALRATWLRMSAFHPFTAGDPRTFGAGTNRGNMFQIRFDHALTQQIRWHALYENLQAGDFYSTAHAAHFLRFEVSYLVAGHVHAGWLKH